MALAQHKERAIGPSWVVIIMRTTTHFNIEQRKQLCRKYTDCAMLTAPRDLPGPETLNPNHKLPRNASSTRECYTSSQLSMNGPGSWRFRCTKSKDLEEVNLSNMDEYLQDREDPEILEKDQAHSLKERKHCKITSISPPKIWMLWASNEQSPGVMTRERWGIPTVKGKMPPERRVLPLEAFWSGNPITVETLSISWHA